MGLSTTASAIGEASLPVCRVSTGRDFSIGGALCGATMRAGAVTVFFAANLSSSRNRCVSRFDFALLSKADDFSLNVMLHCNIMGDMPRNKEPQVFFVQRTNSRNRCAIIS